jgi:hypothetical protein
MSDVFQNFDPLTARRVCTPPPLVRREDTLAGWRGGWGLNILEDAGHSCTLHMLVLVLLPENLRAHLQLSV